VSAHCKTSAYFSHNSRRFRSSVLVGRNRNAFCVVRPPGHHAGINGLLSDAESCGFCLFNNVAAGAMHALSDEKNRPRCERCAIVDIDAHHGNREKVS
jgi:acetoin utilization deacetylase AcuC-like enzyme